MQYGSIIAVFFVVWWLTFVAVLPIGNKSHHEEESTTLVAGGDPGSPVAPRLVYKMILASILSVLFTALLLWGLTNETLHHYWNR
ncbi:Predicted secreted protein [Devosia crocina]|uniref:Predicted secreted protein n=1 Tax=Devosia crocina TaxID=429728 RepID=A0A1I7NCR2_9HYPH|nr:DUF1467 family protein [Devosia crocina]SFV32464.1 Predicted secreted protein [Devosia crocina]